MTGDSIFPGDDTAKTVLPRTIQNAISRKEHPWDKHIAVALVAIYIAAVSVLVIYDHDLWNPHEHRVGAIVKEMVDSGNLVVPKLNGQPFLQKPPLYHVTAVLVHKIVKGEPARTFRMTSALFGLLTLIAIARIGYLFGGLQIALASAAVLTTMAGFLQASHFIVVDAALVAFVALSLWAFVEYYLRERWVYLILVWIFTAGAFLSKGLIGIALIWPGILAFLLWSRKWRQIFSPTHLVGLMTFVAISAIWLVPLALYDGGKSLHYWLFDQNLGRFLGSSHGHHSEGPWFYIPGFFVITLPWSPWLFGLALDRLRRWRTHLTWIEILSICWAGVGLILLSVSQNKRELYAYPLLAPAALLLAVFLGNRQQLWGSRIWSLSWAILSLLTVPTAMLAHILGYVVYPSDWFYFTIGTLTAVSGFFAIRRLAARPGGLGVPAFWIAPCLLFVQIAILYIPAAEPIVSHRPGMQKIAELIGPNEMPLAYRLGETDLGSFSFYTGRRVILIQNERDLSDHMLAHPHRILLVRKKYWPFRKNPEDLGRQLLGSIKVGQERWFYVLRLDRPIKLRQPL